MRRTILIAVLILVAFACSKDDLQPSSSRASLLKVMNVDSDYAARDVAEFPDGSVLQSGVSIPEAILDAPTNLPAYLARYSPEGVLQWQIEVPEIIQQLWHCIVLSNGNVAAVGFNSVSSSTQMGIVVFSPDGDVLAYNTFINFTSFTAGGEVINGMDITELPNGNIALAMPSSQGGNMLNLVRLIIYTPSLAKILDKLYLPDNVVTLRTANQISVRADAEGNILVNGRDNGFNNDILNIFAFVLKIDGTDFSPIYHQLIDYPVTAWPSNLAVTDQGSAVWVSTNVEEQFSIPWFSLRQQEAYLIGPSASIWKSDGNPANTVRRDFSGFPKNGYFSRVIKCSEGGYILLGTCNINDNQLVPSEYQIMMVKVSESLEVEWMQFPKTNSSSVAGDIIETETGYLVSATHLSMGEISKPVVFRTDKQGIIK